MKLGRNKKFGIEVKKHLPLRGIVRGYVLRDIVQSYRGRLIPHIGLCLLSRPYFSSHNTLWNFSNRVITYLVRSFASLMKNRSGETCRTTATTDRNAERESDF